MTATKQEDPLVDFSNLLFNEDWKVVTDEVMGGCSNGSFKILASKLGCFSGHISLKNNGGFSTVKIAVAPAIINKGNGIKIIVLGDGNTYSFRISTSESNNYYQYKVEFTTEIDKWQSFKFDFNEFDAVYRGQPVPDAPPLKTQHIETVGFLIANKQMGEFCLYTSQISIYT